MTRCIVCSANLIGLEKKTCDKCIDPKLDNTCEVCGGGRAVPVRGEWCENLQDHESRATND
jgi:hypothetical protein